MRNSQLYSLIAKLTLKGGFDFERDPEFSDDERGFIRQGINDLAYFDPNFHEKYAFVAEGTERKPARKAKGV